MKSVRILYPFVIFFLSACAAHPAETDAVSTAVFSIQTPPAPVATAGEESYTDAEPVLPPSENFRIGTRISTQIGDDVLHFINLHYAYVMTPVLSEEVRRAVQGPDLILYRSIQGTWEGFKQFDWAHINATENMFEHHEGERILTLWSSWLMNADDLVEADAADAMNHWINYYAVTASQQVREYDYDGLFIDSASHRLSPAAVRGKMPEDYNPEDWYGGRLESLAFIKSYLPDKSVIFNGLHSRGGAEKSLANTDGGMWEVFAFKPQTGAYLGFDSWFEALELTANRNSEDIIVLVLKEQPDLDKDIQKRVFTVASYLLVSNENVILSMTSSEHINSPLPLYYPEYSLDFGAALESFRYSAEEGIAVRRFEHGLVLVNPHENRSLHYSPKGSYLRVIPFGGGEVAADGSWQGSLDYEPVDAKTIDLPPLSALLLFEQ